MLFHAIVSDIRSSGEPENILISQIIGDFQQCETMGSCLLNFLLVRVKLLIWWDFCRFFKVLLEQLLKFLLIIYRRNSRH